jgi:hypothetical protein
MKEPFKQRFGPKNLENFTITNEYDAFRLFFDDEIYTTIIKYTLEKNYNRYLESIYQHCNGFLLRRPSY